MQEFFSNILMLILTLHSNIMKIFLEKEFVSIDTFTLLFNLVIYLLTYDTFEEIPKFRWKYDVMYC